MVDIGKDISNFYSESSVFVPNKFDVILRGPYVEAAILFLEERIKTKPELSYRYNRWKRNHVITVHGFMAIDFKWACKDISIPTTKIKTQSSDGGLSLTLDTMRNMKYVYSQSYEGAVPIKLTITEDAHMMWYQFFNSLGNTYFSSLVHTARDSIHKLGIDIYTYLNVNNFGTGEVGFEKGPMFEFNSISYTGSSDIKFDQGSSDIQEFPATFVAPNPFQGVFKHSRKGMINTVSDDIYISDYKYKGVTTNKDFLSDDSGSNYVEGAYAHIFSDRDGV